MAWWIARFECGEELEVSTATQDKQVAWEKVKGMFPNKELVDLMTEDDERSCAVLSLEEWGCLLYTSPSPRDATLSRMPSSA